MTAVTRYLGSRWDAAATVTLVALWIAGCLIVAEKRENAIVASINDAALQADRGAASTAAQYLSQRFAAHRGVVHAMAYDHHIQELLQRLEIDASDPTSLAWQEEWLASSSTLAEIADAIDINPLFLADMRGMVRAASDRSSKDAIASIDVSKRPYFQAATHGRFGEQFAFGFLDKVPGYFVSAPVKNADDVVGVLVARTDLRKFGWIFRLASGSSILLDQHHVAVLAPDNSIEAPCQFPDMRPLLTVEELQSRYGTRDLPVCTGKDSKLVSRISATLIQDSPKIEGTELRVVHVGNQFPNYGSILIEHRLLWVGLALVGTATIILGFRTLHYLQDLKTRAIFDALTGLFNRAHTREVANVLLGADDRDPHRYMAALLLDIDHFKRVNDTHGHAAGDAVLRQLAAILTDAKRKADVLGRWGGEEFVIFGHVEGEAEALAFAGRVRQSVAAHRFVEKVATPEIVTVSIGVALRNPGETLDSLVNRADAALYEAKAAGRNCVRMATPVSRAAAVPTDNRRMA